MGMLLVFIFLYGMICVPDSINAQALFPEIQLYCLESVAVGEPMLLSSLMTLTSNNRSVEGIDAPVPSFRMTWLKEDPLTTEKQQWVICFGDSCMNFREDYKPQINMTRLDEFDGSITWLSSLLFPSATEQLGGRWFAQWEFAEDFIDAKTNEYYCDVEVKPIVPHNNCSSSLIGYPAQLSSRFLIPSTATPSQIKLQWYKGNGTNITLWATCINPHRTDVDCRFHGQTTKTGLLTNKTRRVMLQSSSNTLQILSGILLEPSVDCVMLFHTLTIDGRMFSNFHNKAQRCITTDDPSKILLQSLADFERDTKMMLAKDSMDLESSIIMVSDFSLMDVWTTVWHLSDSKNESSTCTPMVRYSDPSSDCLQPIMTLSSLEVGEFRDLEVILICFTREIKSVDVTGNYSSAQEDIEMFLPQTQIARIRSRISRKSEPGTVLMGIFNVSIVDGPVIKRSMVYHIMPFPAAARFTRPVYTAYIDDRTDSGALLEIVFTETSTPDYSLQITKSFPVRFETYFKLVKEDNGIHKVFLNNKIPQLYSLVDFKFEMKLMDFMTGHNVYGLLFIKQGSSIQPQCAFVAYYTVYTNATRAVFDLPCTIYDTDGLIVKYTTFPKHVTTIEPESSSFLQIEFDLLSHPYGIGKENDNAKIDIVYESTVKIVTSIEVYFDIVDVPQIPVLLSRKASARSVDLLYEVAPNTESLSEMLHLGVIKYFWLEISDRDGVVVFEEKGANMDNAGKLGTLSYTVKDLEPSSVYMTQLTTVGNGMNATTGYASFTTTPEAPLKTPSVRSSHTDLVVYGERVGFNCSSTEHEIQFLWYHNDALLEKERDYVLSLLASDDAKGVYYCVIYDKHGRTQASKTYNLSVEQSGAIRVFSRAMRVTLQREWIPELDDVSSLWNMAMRFYFGQLVDHAMIEITNYLRNQVLSFRPGSILADVLIQQQISDQQQPPEDITPYLQEQLNTLDFAFEPNQISLSLNHMGVRFDNVENFVIEGRPLQMYCEFSIIASTKPNFDIIWKYNGSVIDTTRSSTFTVSNSYTKSVWKDLGSMEMYNYTHNLEIQEFPVRLAGAYKFEIRIQRSPQHSYLGDIHDDREILLRYQRILRQPQVTIHPRSVQVKDASKYVNISCSYTNTDTISVVNGTGMQLMPPKEVPQRNGVRTFSVPTHNKEVKCLAKSSYNLKTLSDSCQITIIQSGASLCSDDVDRRGLLWKTSAVGITTTKYCPVGYSGIVTRECLQDGTWEESDYQRCRMEELESVQQEIQSINEDGLEVTQQQMKKVSASLNDSIAEPDLIYSGDIIQVVDILDEVGKAVDTSDDDEYVVNVVYSPTLENFASATDSILSSDDSEWETLTVDPVGEAVGVGSKLVVAMDKIAVSSLQDAAYPTEPIVKKNVAIKRDTFSQDDIIFPDHTEESYEKYDGWVVSSKTRLKLSADNFGDSQETIGYAIVLFNGMDSKFVVNSTEQEKYNLGRDLRHKEVSSDVIAFSLTKDIQTFTSPLDLEFQITKENYSSPVCAYLDTTLGTQPVWSSKGCRTIISSQTDIVKCQCNHLTNFAILMSPYGTSENDDHNEILSFVTYVGCGISIICLIITIVMHAITWKYVKEERSVLHLNLSVILILGYATFLAGINQTNHDTGCTAVAALLHFLFLVVFFLMLAEGFQILMSVTFVFSKESHLKRLLFMAYFVPLVIVGVTLGVTQADGYRDTEYCWLTVDRNILWTFVGPALFVILMNFIILLITLRQMMSTVAMRAKDVKAKTKSAIRAVCVLSPLFGITWVFGVFSLNESLVAFQYLFAIFNSLQGFLVFLFHCAFNNQIKDGLRHMLRKHRSRSFSDDHMFSSSKDLPNTNSQAALY